jgi:hypothetical protein
LTIVEFPSKKRLFTSSAYSIPAHTDPSNFRPPGRGRTGRNDKAGVEPVGEALRMTEAQLPPGAI